MYHQVQNKISAFENHLRYISYNYPIILPGEKLQSNTINVCLTFDDATIDFYTHVFPLLNALNIRAVVAIPTGWVDNKIEFCTWNQLREMQVSSKVHCAVHGHNHLDMSATATNVTIEELNFSIAAFKQNLNITPQTFVYPYGRMNVSVHNLIRQHFTYIMRIGDAMNHNWHNNDNLLYRVNAELFWLNEQQWNWKYLMKWRLKYYINKLRSK
jgi:peptidoglycan/xylan/chitin deacetylase (PgdA/CDA1 family)